MKVQLGKVGKVLFNKGYRYKLKAKIHSRIGSLEQWRSFWNGDRAKGLWTINPNPNESEETKSEARNLRINLVHIFAKKVKIFLRRYYMRKHLSDKELEYSENGSDVVMLNANWKQEGGGKKYRLKPYWGNPAVRNFRGSGGNLGIIDAQLALRSTRLSLPGHTPGPYMVGQASRLILW